MWYSRISLLGIMILNDCSLLWLLLLSPETASVPDSTSACEVREGKGRFSLLKVTSRVSISDF